MVCLMKWHLLLVSGCVRVKIVKFNGQDDEDEGDDDDTVLVMERKRRR